MPFDKFAGFTFQYAGQEDTPDWTPDDTRTNMDQRGIDIQTFLNAFINAINSVTEGNSGADHIGASPIDSLNGNTVMALLKSLKTLTDSNFGYLYGLIQGVTLGQIPPKTITGDKIADEVMLPIMRELANIEAVLAIDSQSQLNTGKFYDLFTGDNSYSCALMDTTRTNLKNAADAGAAFFDVVDSTGIEVGREYTIQDDVNAEDVIVQSVVGTTVTLAAATTKAFKKNAALYRSNVAIDTTAQTMKMGAWLDYVAEIE